MAAEDKLVVWPEPQGLVYHKTRETPFMAFSVGDQIDMLEGNSADWIVEKVSHAIYWNGTADGHQVTLTVRPA